VDLAVHDLDLLRCLGFTETPVVIEAWADRDGDAVRAQLDCGGLRADLACGYASGCAKVRRFSIEGERGRIECDLIARTASTSMEDMVSLAPAGDEPLLNEWHALLAGTGPSPLDGLAALEVALAIAIQLSPTQANAATPQAAA
jgi:predicted dehydrogenase